MCRSVQCYLRTETCIYMHVYACVHAKTHTITWQSCEKTKQNKKASIVLQMRQHSWHIKNMSWAQEANWRQQQKDQAEIYEQCYPETQAWSSPNLQTYIKENPRQVLYSLSSLTYLFPRNKHKGVLEKSGSSKTWMWESVQVNSGTENLLVRLAWLICGGWGWGFEILGSISSVSKYSWKTRG